eukprot:352958-Chlamydomonas_euryale.AAC.7
MGQNTAHVVLLPPCTDAVLRCCGVELLRTARRVLARAQHHKARHQRRYRHNQKWHTPVVRRGADPRCQLLPSKNTCARRDLHAAGDKAGS